nr:olfactory receptor 52I2-like [Meriones unguiculatus]
MSGPSHNHTVEAPGTFFLVGIPGLQSSYLWLAISLSAMYSIALFGNTLIITVVCVDSTLQEPMYFFLCVLAAVDIVMVAKLVCADPMPSSLYSLICSSIIVGSDMAFIAASYMLILRAVFSLSSKNAQLKALSTCGSHVGVMCLFYLPGIASIYIAWLWQDVVPLHTRVLLADLYLIIPPTLNPVIYGIRTKQIQERMWMLLTCFSRQGS